MVSGGRFSLLLTTSGDVWVKGIMDGRGRDSQVLWQNKLAQGIRSLEMLSRKDKEKCSNGNP